jgi:hypothetical protein
MISNKLCYFSTILFLLTILTACSVGAPDNDRVLELVHSPTYLGGETGKWAVAKKLKCHELSASAHESGITEAWLVEYTFEYRDPAGDRQREARHPATMVNRAGQWELHPHTGCP